MHNQLDISVKVREKGKFVSGSFLPFLALLRLEIDFSFVEIIKALRWMAHQRAAWFAEQECPFAARQWLDRADDIKALMQKEEQRA